MFSYCCNNPICRVDFIGSWYEEIGYLTNDDLDTLARGIDNLREGAKLPTVVYDIVTTGIGFIPNPVTTGISTAVSVVELGWSLFGHSKSEELGAIRIMIDDTRYKYRSDDYYYRISLLFGSHSNEFKLEVLDYVCESHVSGVTDGGVKWGISSCRIDLIETVVFEFRWNDIYDDLQCLLNDMGIPLDKNDVEWKFSYI